MWAGLVVVTGLVGDLWEYLNPFAALYAVLGRVLPNPSRRLPERLGIWIPVLLYFAFATFELASGYANHQLVVGSFALVYTVFTLAGMALVGRDAWLGRVKFLSVLFDLVARFSPVEVKNKI